MRSVCATYPCGTHDCIELGDQTYHCVRPQGALSCSFEDDEDGCNVLVDLHVSGDSFDPAINTGDYKYV